MYSPTVEGDAFTLRAIARTLIPAPWYSRRTSRILRMDNLRFAIVGPPPKAREGPTNGRLPRVAQLPISGPSQRSGANRKNDRFPTGITVQFAPESVIGLPRNQ